MLDSGIENPMNGNKFELNVHELASGTYWASVMFLAGICSKMVRSKGKSEELGGATQQGCDDERAQ